MEKKIAEELRESAGVKEKVAQSCTAEIAEAAEAIASAYKKGRKLVVFGCGGSAADAQHIAAEFVGKYRRERKPLPAIALTTNTSVLTAISNDYSFDSAFERQIEAFVESGDVALGISTSGNSESVVRALKKAKEKGAVAIALTGEGGGRLKEVAEILIAVPSKETPRIQEAHIAIAHIICGIVEEALFGKKK